MKKNIETNINFNKKKDIYIDFQCNFSIIKKIYNKKSMINQNLNIKTLMM